SRCFARSRRWHPGVASAVSSQGGLLRPRRGSSARCRQLARILAWKRERAWLWARGSSHDREQPAPTHDPGPTPYFPSVLALKDREEYDLRATDDVLERHIADLAFDPAVGRVVAIVAHHEEMAFRHLIHLGVVVETVVDQVEAGVAHAIGQSFAPALDPCGAAAFLGLDEILDALALDRF